MNNRLQLESVDYFMRLNRILGPLWYDLQKLFPRVDLKFDHYDETTRLLPEEYKAALWRYNILGLGESIDQLNELCIDPIANDLRKLKPRIEGISLEGLMDSIGRLDNMLARCTQYTSEVDIFDESGVFINVVGGIDELRSILHDIWDILVGLKPTVVNPAPLYPVTIGLEPETANSGLALINDTKIKPLSHAQISLIRIYEGKPVTKTNAQAISEEYGHFALNAGRVLLRTYNPMEDEDSRLNRRDIESDIDTIKYMLSIDALKRAESELIKIRDKQR